MSQHSKRPARTRQLAARFAIVALLAFGTALSPGLGHAAKKEAAPAGPPPPTFSKPVQKLLKASQDAFDKQDFVTSLAVAREALAAASTDDDKRFAMRFVYRCAVPRRIGR